MRPLVYVEDRDDTALEDSLAVLSHVAALAGEAAAVLCGDGVTGLAADLGAFGAGRVFVADDPALAAPLPQPRVDVLARILGEEESDAVFFATSALTADVAAGLADRLGAGLNWDLVELKLRDGRLVGRRLALQDTVLVEVGWRGAPQLALVRPGAFTPVRGSGKADVEAVPVEIEEWSAAARFVELARDEGGTGASIEDAEIVVSGGRGLGGPEGFRLLEELAEALGGAVAASLPAVEIGWYPQRALVGQSGRSVAPRLYLACGISGAIQHKLGMQNAGTVVAINRDPGAQIFQFSDLAVVGDLYEIVPRLTELVRDRNRQ
jgi:electron transfer flavoprotein alpha subunit